MTKEEMIRIAQDSARVCYSEKEFHEIETERDNPDLINLLKTIGHLSPFEHPTLTLGMKGIPKALAMVFNNEKDYVTSEKSARYTVMKDVEPLQKEKYNKWIEMLHPVIDKAYPSMSDQKKREMNIGKLCQENARYMTSVFTPTQMKHSINFRQLNFLIYEFEGFVSEYLGKKSEPFKARLAESMQEFLKQTSQFRVEGLKNQSDRHLSFFSKRKFEEHFGDVYSTTYDGSFAQLAQAHRHRTISYNVLDGDTLGAPLGVFVPDVLPEDMKEMWVSDLMEISKYDFSQAQLIRINERGRIEDFRSKTILRLDGPAQYEIMKQTKKTAEKYSKFKTEVSDWIKPKCAQNMICASPCVWGPKKALERIV